MTTNDKGRDQIVLSGAIPADCAAVILYTTFPTYDSALVAGRLMVEQRLVGCVNVLPKMTSIYVWQGHTETADEVVLLAKMPSEAFGAAADALNKIHPYDTPAILALPVAAANISYIDWLRDGTGPMQPT